MVGWAIASLVGFAAPPAFPGPREESNPAGGATAAPPAIQVDQPERDFGRFRIGPLLHHTFQIRNTGGRPLDISGITPSCDCIVPTTKVPSIPAGRSAELTIAVDTHQLFGSFRHTLTLATNDPARKTLTLSIRGRCEWYVDISPRRAAFGRLRHGEAAERELFVTSLADRPIRVTLGTQPQAGKFRARLEEIEPGRRFKLIVRVEPPYEPGRMSALIDLLTDVEDQHLLTLRAEALVPDLLEIHPSVVYLPDGTGRAPMSTQPVARTLQITNHGPTPLVVRGIQTSEQKLRVSLSEEEAGRRYRILVMAPAGYRAPPKGGAIWLTTGDPHAVPITIPIRPGAEEEGGLNAPGDPAELRPALTMKGNPAPPFELKTEDGREVSRKELASFPATVLNFVAPNCPFCRGQIPLVETVRSKYEAQGVRFVNVGQTFRSEVFTGEEALSVMNTLGSRLELAMDAGNQTARRFRVTSLPSLFVLRPDGQVAEVILGVKGDVPYRLSMTLDEILAGESGPPASPLPIPPSGKGS